MKIEEGEGFVLEWLYQVPGREPGDIVAILGPVEGVARPHPCIRDGVKLVPIGSPESFHEKGPGDRFPVGVVTVVTPHIHRCDRKMADGEAWSGVILGIARVQPATAGIVGDFHTNITCAVVQGHKLITFNAGDI